MVNVVAAIKARGNDGSDGARLKQAYDLAQQSYLQVQRQSNDPKTHADALAKVRDAQKAWGDYINAQRKAVK